MLICQKASDIKGLEAFGGVGKTNKERKDFARAGKVVRCCVWLLPGGSAWLMSLLGGGFGWVERCIITLAQYTRVWRITTHNIQFAKMFVKCL